MKKLPSKSELLAWIQDNPDSVGKREIARAFGIKGSDRVELKRMLRELQDDGSVARRGRRIVDPDRLPPVTVLQVTEADADGDLFAVPQVWEGEGSPPRILLMPGKRREALAPGDRVLARLSPVKDADHAYEGRPIKRIERTERRLLGIFRESSEGGHVIPVDKKAERDWRIPAARVNGAKDGELVEAAALSKARGGPPMGEVVERLGDPGAPKQVSLIAMAQHQIPHVFPEDVLAEAERASELIGAEGREDLRALPFVTIDPADARDHDDAVYAVPDDDPANPNGHVVWVAIADVAHYVRVGSALDDEARRRGNSTYFPDRVSPMLPERLSAELCSLHEGVDRPCFAVRLVLDAEGEVVSHRFVRGLMRSAASLSYGDVQDAVDGGETSIAAELIKSVIQPLFAAYETAARARDRRQPLDLDLPERRIELDDAGAVSAVRLRERLDAHRLVEEFMILANVAAASAADARRQPILYRVHEEPNPDKLDALREVVETLGLTLARGQVLKTRHLNHLLTEARASEASETVSMSVLRAQTQAYYAAENFGHFGLNLRRYAHFTSPIRRYADLVVHRSLIHALGLGDDGLSPAEVDKLAETAEHISRTERRSMEAERDTVDRYLAAYMSDRTGAEFEGRVSGVARFGAFVKLDETGADGLIPVSTLGTEYFTFDAESQTLTGERSRQVIALGMRATVRLVEATPVTGGLIFELLSLDGSGLKLPTRRKGSGGPRRRLGEARLKRAKLARKRRRS